MNEVGRAKSLLASRIARKSYLSSELRLFLQKKGISEESAALAIEAFTESGYINDEEWALSEAKRWARLGKGPKWLLFHLQQKKVPAPFISRAMELFSPDLRMIIEKKAKGDFSPLNCKKIINFLLRKGFDYDSIDAAFRQINK